MHSQIEFAFLLNLHSDFLAFACTGSLILALGTVELIPEGTSDLTMGCKRVLHHSYSTICSYYLFGFKQVGCTKLYGKVVFQEVLV